MTDVPVTFQLPKELVERAIAAGVRFESQTNWVIDALEVAIRRQEAGRRLLEVAEQLSALPDDAKPTLEEIDEEIRAYWQQKSATE